MAPEVILHRVPFTQVSSLAFLLYEHIATFDDEVSIIWPKPNSAWIKWVFLVIRYFGLFSQLANRILDFCILAHLHVVPKILQRWYISQVAIGFTLMIMVEIVLMARVYALYEKDDTVFLVFVSCIACEVITFVLGIFMSRPGDSFDLEMYLTSASRAYAYFGSAAILSQVIILVLTLKKYRDAVQAGWGREPIMVLTVRDGTIAFSILLCVTAATVATAVARKDYATVASSWFVAIVSGAGCRLILNLQKFPGRLEHRYRNAECPSPGAVQLTTVHSQTDAGSRSDLQL